MSYPNLIVIGGFALNHKVLNCLEKLAISYKFININSIPDFSDINSGVTYLRNHFKNNNNIVIGYSMGGIFAISLAHKFPQLITKVGLINSTPKFIQDKSWKGINLIDFKYLKSKLVYLPINEFMHYFINLAIYPNTISNLEYKMLYDELNKRHLNDLLTLIGKMDLREELRTLNSQLFCINSVNDKLVPVNKLKSHYTSYLLNDSSHLYFDEAHLTSILTKEILC